MNIYIVIGTARAQSHPGVREPFMAEIHHAGFDIYEAMKVLALVRDTDKPDDKLERDIWLEIWRDGKRIERMG